MTPLALTELGLSVVDLRKSGTSNPPRDKPVGGVILHSPGVTYIKKIVGALGHDLTDEQELIDHAVASNFDGRPYQPGYIVGQSGFVYMLEDDMKSTSHSAMLGQLSNSKDWRNWAHPLGGKLIQHGRNGHVVYDWWDAVFGKKAMPGDLSFEARPNRYIGIDLRPRHEAGTPQFCEVQIEALAQLVVALSREHNFKLDIKHVLTHSLADPIRRGTNSHKGAIVGVHWDPPAKHFDYAAFMARFKGAT